MLDRDFAEKFIDRVTRYTDYNVNIMDERGIIIASRDKARIGQYHEVAYRLVTGTEEIVDTTGMSFPNVLPGINMVIATGGVREGVVGVTGVPDEVRPVALKTPTPPCCGRWRAIWAIRRKWCAPRSC